ncbi:MAG: hypothetical protein A3A96_03340 [Candidatus Zambryskibacteria bacterium RIFCSPLOWO2_01_FULL_39_39]|uniref:KilA-N DNA-binding domain-containing protein n=1 Tax=Candidatus Zambryskibacteria bacterium RIFCSPLOWO2_01_FULL_39_39 TaxID=1802758 RepID=A0A1G2TWL2_9BACT|nr:MAG: hypothetical protein A2644_02730 [Candidatus Zambryskibacteria bacterium RIFCSPHIGHO2_01_FULL_39_63]OHA94492.1 MAG: hypothetical protein A3B88_01585 [Candidatus Zambryskibacteria bacterium RIFCSPHIGHO2_02_FULL_39_19]OHA97936.1 MAG: hypothetical protein A3F20_00640 [Candidatus Zambryskibacteria bacterium RIFCSPHIGHO2_12_FULL_39_21]OHB01687.1 MAG: hypothetical protein A3A96_03340 [Candidatus Zambryskibacteria bacterium RIFCSPLOWO2_01_FULL_39_39]
MPIEIIENKIYLIRGVKVMLDKDLAKLYQVETRILNQAVKRNLDRFPSDFMFQLNNKEINAILHSRSQFVTLKRGQNIKYLPYVFTEQGVAMLSAVLKSKRAVDMSIAIVRAFIRLREMLATHKKLLAEFEKFKKIQKSHGQHIINILNVISQLINPPVNKNKEPIGFRPKD